MSTKRIIDSFWLDKYHSVYLIGGGGKTSLMFALAETLVQADRSVITTTSTKILYPQEDESKCVIAGPWQTIMGDVETKLVKSRHVTIAREVLEEERKKLCGYAVPELDAISESACADYLLVEADGSAGRSLKAHMDHEPVLSELAELLIVVIGVDCLGKPMNPEHVHRAELLCRRLNRPPDSAITVEDIAAIVFHPDGYLKKAGKNSHVLVFISKTGTPEDRGQAAVLASSLKCNDSAGRISKIITGEVRNKLIRIDLQL
jgi:probable selenium-dependent hydroxylase accessory protein YqeC